MRKVQITWVDSASLAANDAWSDPGNIPTERGLQQRTVGWLVRESKTVAVIAHTRNDGHDTDKDTLFMGLLAIPKRSITKMRTL